MELHFLKKIYNSLQVLFLCSLRAIEYLIYFCRHFLQKHSDGDDDTKSCWNLFSLVIFFHKKEGKAMET